MNGYETAMGIAATFFLLAGVYGLWILSGWLDEREDARNIAAIATIAVIAGWFATTQFSDIALKWIGWHDYVFFERIPLFFAILLLLFLPLRRIKETRQFGLILITGLFGLYALAEASGPLWLRMYLPRIDDTQSGTQVLQSTGWTCGPAALAWALRERGVQVSEREATVLSATLPLHGVSDRGLVRAAHRLGFRATIAHGADWQDILNAPKPALVDMKLSMTIAHTVVLIRAGDDTVILGDPLHGRISMKRAEFVEQWQQTLITLRPTAGRYHQTPTRAVADGESLVPSWIGSARLCPAPCSATSWPSGEPA